MPPWFGPEQPYDEGLLTKSRFGGQGQGHVKLEMPIKHLW